MCVEAKYHFPVFLVPNPNTGVHNDTREKSYQYLTPKLYYNYNYCHHYSIISIIIIILVYSFISLQLFYFTK